MGVARPAPSLQLQGSRAPGLFEAPGRAAAGAATTGKGAAGDEESPGASGGCPDARSSDDVSGPTAWRLPKYPPRRIRRRRYIQPWRRLPPSNGSMPPGSRRRSRTGTQHQHQQPRAPAKNMAGRQGGSFQPGIQPLRSLPPCPSLPSCSSRSSSKQQAPGTLLKHRHRNLPSRRPGSRMRHDARRGEARRCHAMHRGPPSTHHLVGAMERTGRAPFFLVRRVQAGFVVTLSKDLTVTAPLPRRNNAALLPNVRARPLARRRARCPSVSHPIRPPPSSPPPPPSHPKAQPHPSIQTPSHTVHPNRGPASASGVCLFFALFSSLALSSHRAWARPDRAVSPLVRSSPPSLSCGPLRASLRPLGDALPIQNPISIHY